MPFLQHCSVKPVFLTCLIVWACFSTATARPDSVSVAFADWVAPELITLAPQHPKKPLFWVVNFGTARTLSPKKIGFAAGMGGQVVVLGDPRKTSAFFTIPHAGFRLAPIPLPFASVGPGFGINLDAKYYLPPPPPPRLIGGSCWA
ncbi:hypothetical protein [Larkinella punicea]|nr:hypothetical protein [Larkinella punicea]